MRSMHTRDWLKLVCARTGVTTGFASRMLSSIKPLWSRVVAQPVISDAIATTTSPRRILSLPGRSSQQKYVACFAGLLADVDHGALDHGDHFVGRLLTRPDRDVAKVL